MARTLDTVPDVLLVDVRMPGLDGIAVTRQVTEKAPAVRVLVMTMVEDDTTVLSAMRAGARGYLLKGADVPSVLRAVRGVASGEAVFGPVVAARLIGWFAELPAPAGGPAVFPELTDRERQVLHLIALGRRNPEIAQALFLSPKTVRNHVSTILSKLQVTDRAQAALRARDAGLG